MSLTKEPLYKSLSGNYYELDFTLRKQIKPDYEEMFYVLDVNNVSIAKENIDAKRKEIKAVEDFLVSCKSTMKGKRILEFGYGDAVRTFALKEVSEGFVKGIDTERYFTKEQYAFNTKMRDEFSKYFNLKENPIFEEGSIVDFTDEPYDFIFSWDTLEHVLNPEQMFNNLYKLLKPNGWAINIYSPFFAFNGGHSLCTLDFPYGHCRLSNDDVVNYIKELRPDEVKLATPFFLKNLNRMTQNEAIFYATSAGFYIERFFTSPNIPLYQPSFVDEVRKYYPMATPTDLMCDRVTLLLRK